jgi:hypothetical protein
MTATIEPTHLVNQQNGIWLDKQARFRFGKYKGFRVRDVCKAAPNISIGSPAAAHVASRHPRPRLRADPAESVGRPMSTAIGRRLAQEAAMAAELALERNTDQQHVLVCETCRRRFASRRPDSRWCSDSCRALGKAKW